MIGIDLIVVSASDGAAETDLTELVDGKVILLQKHFLPSSEFFLRMESSTVACASNLERIYSDYYISDMIVSSQPIQVNSMHGLTNLTDYKTEEPTVFVDESYFIMPVLETSNGADNSLSEETLADSDDSSLYLAIHQLRPCNQDPDVGSECFDTELFIKNMPDTDIVNEGQKAKSITLVLDLDETLVHSTLEHCDDADFTFPVDFNMKIHTVYVKQRPFLHTFLQKVAAMFEVVVFTASQSIYAEKLLDIIDPNRNLVSRRAYRESCIFFDGSYTKDLTILGVDLAKVAIIDNSPQVYRWQVNNGIPIKSWFDDKSDTALLSLLPFLESLVEAEDVRPIIAKRFSKMEY